MLPRGDLDHARDATCRKQFTATETVRDVVIGMADGLTVPFALAAGLAAAAAYALAHAFS